MLSVIRPGVPGFPPEREENPPAVENVNESTVQELFWSLHENGNKEV